MCRERQKEVAEVAIDKGVDFAADMFGLSRETVRRYIRGMRNAERPQDDVVEKNVWLKKIAEQYSDKELRQIANGKLGQKEKKQHIHNFEGEELTIGVLSDTHIGSKYTDLDHIKEAYEVFAREGVDFVTHSGDVTEGLSNRAGHVYECTEVGYDAQREKSIEVLSQWDLTPQYIISGNHDLWARMTAGANIVKDICRHVEGAVFLGDNEGDLQVRGATIRLWHGLDGSSYAHSYRLQKLVESFTGGDKPDVLLAGHVHKATYCFDRHVHCLSTGCIQKQSSWMRGKRLPAHTGFWVVRLTVHDKGVARFAPAFFPFYV